MPFASLVASSPSRAISLEFMAGKGSLSSVIKCNEYQKASRRQRHFSKRRCKGVQVIARKRSRSLTLKWKRQSHRCACTVYSHYYDYFRHNHSWGKCLQASGSCDLAAWMDTRSFNSCQEHSVMIPTTLARKDNQLDHKMCDFLLHNLLLTDQERDFLRTLLYQDTISLQARDQSVRTTAEIVETLSQTTYFDFLQSSDLGTRS